MSTTDIVTPPHLISTAPYLISEAADALSTGTVTSVQLVTDAIAVADAHDAELGVFISRFNDEALRAAEAADAALAAGDFVGPLHGIPLGIKDIITTRETVSTAQSLVLDPAWSAGDAVVVERLRAAGGIIMGKLTTMEYASGLPDADRPFPIPRNPWNSTRWTGGSSSGTGGAVASNMVFGGLGTDTGGSIRIPSAFCGITGLMPSFGRVPKSGCVPLGYSLDHIGPMARSARDCAIMLAVLAGYDPSDATAIDTPVDDYVGALTGDLTGVRIGVDRFSGAGAVEQDAALDPLMDAAIAVLHERGASITEIRLPHYDDAIASLLVTAAGETLAYHRPDVQSKLGDYAASNRIGYSSHVAFSAADYVQAQRARRVVHRAVMELYSSVDLIVTPTTFVGALAIDDLEPELDWLSSVNTPYWDLVGVPVASAPIGFTSDGLPLAIQVAGRPYDEATVLRAVDAYQRATAWHLAAPSLAG